MKRSKHSLSNTKLLSLDMGELIPIGIYEALPGDTVQQATNALVRASPLLAPVMHPVDVRIHHWFIPNRLMWTEWEDFITGGPDGNNAGVVPTIAMPDDTGATVGSLADYLGVPVGIPGLEVSALPFRAYAKVFNEWYRDQDLVPLIAEADNSGEDTVTNTEIQNIAWERDYFTDARPWEQKGPAVTIPLVGNAPISGIGVSSGATGGAGTPAKTPVGDETFPFQYNSDADSVRLRAQTSGGAPDVFADLDGVSAVTVNALREALALQRYQEARARFGSRYVEYLRYLGVKSSDARLQRPEYLGGGRQTIQFSEVLATADTETSTVGDLRGHGIAAMKSNRYRRFFEEHGLVISCMSVRPKTIYTTGLHKLWNRKIKEDYWQKELEHIGQQEVLNKEIQAGHTEPDGVFGYQDRYEEYRRNPSTVAGEFRTSVLDYWHLAREFSGDVALNGSFVTSVPTKRIFAEQTQDSLYVMAKHSIQARRLVTKTGTSFIY